MSAVHAHPWNTAFSWRRPSVSPRRLCEAELDQFHDQGWLVVEDLIDAATVAAVRAELDEIEADVDALLKGLPDERMFIAEAGAITFAPHAVNQSAAARAVSRHPAIADLCHDLVGPDVRLYWDQVVYKKPEKPRAFPWHQDNGYTYVEPQQYLTVWLSLTDAPVEAGCPWVVPGVHLGGTLAHEYVDPLGYRCFAEHPDAVAAPVRAGGAVVFSSLTPHMTGPNTTGDIRKTYILQYAPDGAEVLQGEAPGPPTGRTPQNDADRQYLVVSGGERVENA
ncbi:MAG: phytanoyl-CoA dioxygenase family protein [Acidimicrobiales bacterium]|nr:phytanoyl-CoA dioxygenase family protein [Acidimicrobiales bacterium]